MNMTDFDFDVSQKKRIAQGAFHKKGGSKSKGCRLPHEDLTPAQQRKLNGPVTTVNLDRPMTWKELTELDDEKQTLYLTRLLSIYGPTIQMLADMFHVTAPTVKKRMVHLTIPAKPVGYKTTKGQREAWLGFCDRQDAVNTELPESTIEVKEVLSTPTIATPCHTTVTFSGTTWENVQAYLLASGLTDLVNAGGQVTIEVKL